MKILIRTDGGLQIGNGHIIRMIALANELVARKIKFAFALKQDDFWISFLKNKGLPSFKISGNEIIDLIKNETFTHLVYDTRNDLTRAEIDIIREKTGIRIIAIDSPEEVRLAADVNLYPPIPQVREWNWEGFEGTIFSGWEYVLLRGEFANRKASKMHHNRVLLSFGSTDPFHLTEWALEMIDGNRLFDSYEFILVVGPQFDRISSIRVNSDFKKLNVTIVQAPDNIVEIFESVDFALIALGVTAYELAALSIPFLFVSISDDHARSGVVFETNGLGYSLGTVNKSLDHFDEKVNQFLNNREANGGALNAFETDHKICDWSKIIEALIN